MHNQVRVRRRAQLGKEGGPQSSRHRGSGGAKSERALQHFRFQNGVAIIAADAHYWPGHGASTGHRALKYLIPRLKPKALVMNGDVIDGATISRHPPIGWESMPALQEEIWEAQQRMAELAKVAPADCKLFWPLGNHDARYNTRLATQVPEVKGVHGTRLLHHFPRWTPCWALDLNGAIVKHRFKGGLHATHNNTLTSGRTLVTGHTHSQKVTPFTDYNGTRWGVDVGMLANPAGPQFLYNEMSPANWRSGFAVMTWRNNELMPPELVTVLSEVDGTVWWRGNIIKV